MRHLKALGVALFAMLALALTATSAFATLPVVTIQLGGAFPLHLQFPDDSKTIVQLNNTGGEKTEDKGILVLLLQTAAGSTGTFEALVLHVKSGTKPCEQTGEKNKEEILIKGTYHLVFASLSPLKLGIAFLVSPTIEYNCEKVKIKVKGCALSEVTDPKAASEDVELATGVLLGDGKGKNLLTSFDNEAGTGTVECIVHANFGVERQAELVIGEPIHLVTLEKKMFSIGPI